MERIGHYAQLPDSWSVVPMQMLCYLTDGEKQNGIERINLDVKYLRGEHDAKTLTSGKYVAANSLLILVDGENSGEVFRTPIDGYQGSTFKQLLINENINGDDRLSMSGLNFLRITAIPGVAGVVPCHGILLIPQMDGGTSIESSWQVDGGRCFRLVSCKSLNDK